MVQGYLNPSPGPPSPVPPSDPPQQVVRGPAGGGEVGSQWDHPTQQQVQRGGPAGWGPSLFSSTDIRERRNPTKDKMSVTTIVSLLNQLCKQKPAGSFKLPKLPESDYCLLCNDEMSVCLGKTSSGIPGIVPSGSSSTVLTTPAYTFSKKKAISALSPSSSLFNPKVVNLQSSTGIPTKTPQRKSFQKPSRPKQKDSEYDSNLRQKLFHILLKTSLNPDDTQKVKKKKNKSSANINSLFRKLSTSEVRCPKKLHSSFKPTFNSTSSNLHSSFKPTFKSTSSSLQHISTSPDSHPSFNPISEPISSSTAFTDSDNYIEVLSYLKSELEDSKKSEIFEIQNDDHKDDDKTGEDLEFEVLRASSPESRRPQSPSPERQQQRVGTPRKENPSSVPSSSGHTPRKDTPCRFQD